MKAILHIAAKDLRRLRGWWLLWIAVLAAPLLWGVRFVAEDPFAPGAAGLVWAYYVQEVTRRALVQMLVLLTGLQALVGYVLTLVVFLEDAAIGTRQFWATRPISRGRLLAGKTLALAVILWAVPVAVSLPWWWWCELGAGDSLLAAIEWGGCVLLVALPAALVASLTDTFARAVLWSVVLIGAATLGVMFFSQTIWRGIAGAGVALAASGLVVTLQYRYRRYTRWLFTVGAVTFVLLGVARVWPTMSAGPAAPAAPIVEENAAEGSSVQVKFDGAHARVIAANDPDRVQQVSTFFTASGIPPGKILHGIQAEQRWQVSATLSRESSGPLGAIYEMPPFNVGGQTLRVFDYRTDEESRRWWEQQNERTTAGAFNRRPGAGEVKLLAQAGLVRSFVDRMRVEPPRFEARLWLALGEAELQAEMPVRPGPWRSIGGGAARITALQTLSSGGAPGEMPGRQRMALVEARVQPLNERFLGKIAGASATWRSEHEWESYALINRATSEIVWLQVSSNTKPREVWINGVRLRGFEFDLYAPRVRRAGAWAPAPGWSEPTLGRLKLRQEALFSREVVVERFEIER